MKKLTKLIICIFLLFLILEFLLFLFKTNHEVTYEIKDNKKIYKIEETYKKDFYYLKIIYKNNNYTIEVPNNFHKRKKITKKYILIKQKI